MTKLFEAFCSGEPGDVSSPFVCCLETHRCFAFEGIVFQLERNRGSRRFLGDRARRPFSPALYFFSPETTRALRRAARHPLSVIVAVHE